MTEVSDYIAAYPLIEFLRLNSKEQNSKIYLKFHAETSTQKLRLRQQKNRYLARKLVSLDTKNDTPNHPTPSKTPLPPSLVTKSPNDPRSPAGGGLQRLTEEILENAIVDVLQTDPAKGLSVALAFLDKKKSLSVEDQDTNISLIALEKIKRKQKEMFT